MKRLLVLAALVALALPAAALAKGPSEATVKGPGLGKTVTFTGSESDSFSSLMQLADAAGFFPAVFAQQPDPMRRSAPKGDLGPKYTIDYTVPGPEGDTFYIKQDAYPYAQPYGFTYTEPGQKIFDTTTGGGWFTASEAQGDVERAGDSAHGSLATRPGSSRPDDSERPLAIGLLLGGAIWFFARRRPAHIRGSLSLAT